MAPRHGALLVSVAFAVALLLTAAPSSRVVVAAASPVAAVEAAKSLAIPAGDGSYGSLKETYEAVQLLTVISKPSVDSAKTCKWLAGLPAATSAEEGFYKVSIAAAAGCKDVKAIVKDATAPLTKAASSFDLLPIYYAAAGLSLVRSKGWAAGELPVGLKKAPAAVLALKADDGTWRGDKNDDAPSVLNAGIALQALAHLHGLKLLDDKQVASASAAADALIARAASTATALPGTAAAVAGYLSLGAAVGDTLGVQPARVAELARDLLEGGLPLSLAEGALWAHALALLDDNSLVVPVFVSTPPHLSISTETQLTVTVATALGRKVPGAAVRLVSAAVGKGAVVSDKDLVASKAGTEFSAKVFSKASTLGAYTLKIKVTAPDAKFAVAGSGSSGALERSLLVTAAMKVSAVTVAVLDGDAGAAETEAKLDLAKKDQIPSALPATHLQKLQVSLAVNTPSGKAFAPHQAVLVMANDAAGISNSYLLKASGATLSLKLNLLESMAKLFHVSGEYSLTLIVGDELMDNSFTWNLGSVDLDLPAAAEDAAKPPAKAVPVAQRFAPQAEISHIFRKPEKRPAFVVSYTFVALVFLPLVILLVGLAILGVNLKAFPSGGVPLLSAFGFHGGIALLLLLYVAFWVQVNLFTTIKLVLVLGLVTAIPGHQLLSYLADSPKVKKE
eukprot:TRINITY_DN9069_c0_g1_i1.p1 TRINITY_DN9069_c0_g1~~TRINITY_DN9069_c0_g1_i1.p1  ORF type:complete len:702 (-),score=75.51 TRINITY_DN9069_c0_g1_i1:195-2222(-)